MTSSPTASVPPSPQPRNFEVRLRFQGKQATFILPEEAATSLTGSELIAALLPKLIVAASALITPTPSHAPEKESDIAYIPHLEE